ncbi:MAG: triose-phosphate isomerase [Thermoanaerobaculia bacterium]
MSEKILIANWKMNLPPSGLDGFVHSFADGRVDASVELVIAPPFPFLPEIRGLIDRQGVASGLAGQDCSQEEKGAFTGEVSAAMLRSVGATHAIVGHSERRRYHHEPDEMIGRKGARAMASGLVPVLCIGEDAKTRDEGGTVTLLESQIRGALDGASSLNGLNRRWILAYEPVWAIGTGRNASPEMVAETHLAIRKVLRGLGHEQVPILYGGSVTPENAEALASVDEVSGFLVGGASLDATKFLAIHDGILAAVAR